ncbi:molybdopterin-dependent oxidoreductase [Pseudomonas tolaasii]|uniref:Molybdopterin-dependent oxidoreductase n=2 Tax=Pseudomonas tolaasii TaxID=29442 RepID=A0A7Y8AT44_PSETO|nr:molybdopterin-dependent oxidoreductase [Pseudomonas tolaasii]ARB27406.1 dehydrogenase [Pseudomonas tolaasii]KAB0467487.1 molybdopterin-dependent oxidoreductase [Pseudomonas tolaasii]MBY8943302.1 molybdopterin-dependent oxidoreductase [Pseudomonas tolaasii]NWC21790.1 molybdopterin-dependent oxidoreductase [Pseudomonas tolaasii]NWC42673.1 molybdopterin-dependent oxidoreductase [Pseudomonas tolaasii]
MTVAKTACILCSRNCGLQVEIEEGAITRIRGDEDHPVTQGYICQKAARLQHYQSHDDRLKHPLRREPDGTFVRVSWDEALDDIARRLMQIRDQHGGDAFAFVGGGGQGNHLGSAYGNSQLRAAMGSKNAYNSLAQEKTGDFWVNGRIFGRQDCHTTEDVEHADYVLFIGCNPFQAHGIPNARDTLKHLKKDPDRTMVVIDPRRSETAKQADIHLQLKPGTDAYLLSAMLAIIVGEGLHDQAFLARHCTGFEAVAQALAQIPVADYAARADVPLAAIERVARGFATARTACIRIDLGIQHTLHTTLNGYLEKLLYLVTGNFGVKGGNNLHTFFLPLLGHTDERDARTRRTAHHGMFPIAGILPPNILPDEILLAGERRIRSVFVDSSNPLLTWPDTAAYEKAFASLELLVVVDVAMTETARMAHYVLPAASQFEKCEATGFNLEFPTNFFHLRHPLFPAPDECLSEPEIYTRLLEKMGVLPKHFPVLSALARHEPGATAHLGYLAALAALFARQRKLMPFAPSIMYRTLGAALPAGLAAAAPLLGLSLQYAKKHGAAVRRAGFKGHRATLGTALFRAILARPQGTLISVHEFEDTWSLLRNEDKRAHLQVPEMLEELAALRTETAPGQDYPFILMAGERRSYNANQIYRDPAWRKVDPHGALRMHPDDASALQVGAGDRVVCSSRRGDLEVVVELDDDMRRGVVSLPHGYGMRYKGGAPSGPALNRITALEDCDPLSRTPHHKYVPVRIQPLASVEQTMSISG